MKERRIEKAIRESQHLTKEARAEYLAQHGAKNYASAAYLAELLEKKMVRKEA